MAGESRELSGETRSKESAGRRTPPGGRLTNELVAALKPADTGNRVRWDGTLPGFGLRVTGAGAKAFVFRYRNADGRDRTITIGSPPAWNVAKAAKEASRLRYEIDKGADPLADKEGKRNAPTVNDLCDRFEREHLPKNLRPGTARDYRSMIAAHIRPAIGRTKVAALRYADISDLHGRIAKDAPYRANRVVAVLSKMCSLAIRWEMRTDNPCRTIERKPENRRERFLSPSEIIRLGDALKAHDRVERPSANAIRLLLLTGARRGEVLGATWDQFDLTAGVWTKPAATTKQKREHRIPLSAPALALLSEIKVTAPDSRYVFPSTHGSLTEIKKSWASVCKAAGINGVRIHDLRHSYASILASSGLSLPIIGALLGHTQPATTARYAHLLDDPLRAATERAGAIIMGNAATSGEVVPLRSGRRP